MSLPLKVYWGIAFSVFLILFTFILTFITVHLTNSYIKEDKGKGLSNLSLQIANNLDRYMWSRYSEITILSKLDSLHSNDSISDKREILNRVQEEIPAFSWIGITDESGMIEASTSGLLENQTISERPVFIEAREGPFIGDVHEALLLNDLLPRPDGGKLELVDISVPLVNTSGDFKGVLAAHLSWEWAREVQSSIINPYIDSGEEMEVFILSSTDQRVILGPESYIGQTLPFTDLTKSNLTNGWEVETWEDDQSFLTGYSQNNISLNYPGLEWTVLIRQPEKAAYTAAHHLSIVILISGIISAAIFALIGFRVAGKIAKPLHRITQQAELYTKGNSANFIPFKTDIKEIEELSSSLQTLINTLGVTESNLLKMEGIAYRDALTNLPNRISLELTADELLKLLNLRGTNLLFSISIWTALSR
ncbi:diguanylate cyclase [Jeotgalibacillus proteolyticus]|uniref:Diguanylate cyclase n=1 Tax=Jeotgalibacillus proteolyticus TaxID=2082395 RepID=A0A2S5GAB5_9BACL|nr:diguanylate cyclase [Jeotgalibacillus proteolyticus]PPA69930.1 diguanylate cyclase [Jeotgalibacillus proteolyticus]